MLDDSRQFEIFLTRCLFFQIRRSSNHLPRFLAPFPKHCLEVLKAFSTCTYPSGPIHGGTSDRAHSKIVAEPDVGLSTNTQLPKHNFVARHRPPHLGEKVPGVCFAAAACPQKTDEPPCKTACSFNWVAVQQPQQARHETASFAIPITAIPSIPVPATAFFLQFWQQ